MTYQLGSLHSSQPRRPERTSEREPPRHPPPRVFSERLLVDGETVQQISTTQDRVHVRWLRRGEPSRSCFRFTLGDLEPLEDAISRTRESGPDIAKNVGRAPCLGGGCIEVSASAGTVLLRMRTHTGAPRYAARLVVEEVDALERAIAHFKTNAASAALRRKETL
jgi:hypothetical protein